MKSIDEAEAQARLDEILEEAQRQPIVIRRQGNDAAAIVSMIAAAGASLIEVTRSKAAVASDSSLASAPNCMTVTSAKLLDILRAISTSRQSRKLPSVETLLNPEHS